ncbi:MAG: hypothetical protein BTN85_0815 [Candidatus Methanohalarchaeum thermophilum]|uniref:Uncharacterized protein n=1 Tax=Methanohalarchaeum thermophilum TaxID=1903181 RepID=A0A1Q6DVE6_METT1|nr:MAG: hypothetical protein BTN85_0815 [Candidatus Methanohalarchaeum thermophilum]
MTASNDIDTVKEAVKRVLEDSYRARCNDNYLILRVLEEMGFASYDLAKEEFELKLDKNDIEKMPAFESIRRTRQKLQEQGEYQASDLVQENQSVEREKIRKRMAQC